MNVIRRSVQSMKEMFGQSSSHVDNEYSRLYEEFCQRQKTTKKIKKDVETLVKQTHALTSTINKLAENFGSVFRGGEYHDLSKNLKDMADVLEANTSKAFEINVEAQVVQTAVEYLRKSGSINQLLKKRKNLLADVNIHRDRLSALQNEQSKDPLKFPKQVEVLNDARTKFYEADAIAKTNMATHGINHYHAMGDLSQQLFGNLMQYGDNLRDSVSLVTQTLCSYKIQEIGSPDKVMDNSPRADAFSPPPLPLATAPPIPTFNRSDKISFGKRRVLIITSNEGGGHAAATRAIKDALPQDGYEIQTVLPTEEIPCSDMYNVLMKKGQFKALGVLVRMQGTAEAFVMGKPRKTVAREIDAFKPHLIISVIPVMTKVIMNLAKERNIPMLVVPTDLTFDHFFCNIKSGVPPTFRVAIPFADVEDKKIMIKSRGFKEGNFVVTGYPLRQEFGSANQQLQERYHAIQRELQIGPNDKVVVIMIGAQGAEQQTLHYISQIVRNAWQICSVEFNTHIVAMCGANEKLQRIISGIATIEGIKLHAIPKVDASYVSALLKHANAFISKPGGSSVNESLALGVYTLYDDASTEGLWWEGANMRYAVDRNNGEVITSDFSTQVRTVIRKGQQHQAVECPGRNFKQNIISLVDSMTSAH
ncbi:processive diacylglycerol beta-glucosyltransferase [Acrasis kona]|uniref:Processive diacylglycerol beta-glucosyltransferase n=1 Tax=Acrasis kona TaxID=1008807 RepID=A0AAW2YY39_9EUKA